MTADTCKAVILIFTILGLLSHCQDGLAAVSTVLPSQVEITAVTADQHDSGIIDVDSRAIADEIQQAGVEQPVDKSLEQQEHKTSLRLIDDWFHNGLEQIDSIFSQLRYQVDGLQQLPAAFTAVWKTVDNQAQINALGLAGQVALIITLALTIEYFFRHLSRSHRQKLNEGEWSSNLFRRVTRICISALLEGLFFAIYAYSSLTLFYFFQPGGGAAHLVAGNLIKATYLIRLVHFVTTILLAPTKGPLRIIPLSDWGAAFLAHWIVLGSIPILVLIRFGAIFNRLELDKSIFLSLIGLVILITYSLFLCIILISKNKVRASIEKTADETDPFMTRIFAEYWHLAALLLVTLLTLNWELRLLATGKIHFGKVLSSCLLLVFFFAVDYWGQRLLKLAFRGDSRLFHTSLFKSIQQGDQRPEDQQPTQPKDLLANYSKKIAAAYRLLLLALCVFILFSLWDINVPIGRTFTLGALSVLTISVVAYLSWQFFKIWIDTLISSEMPEQSDTDEGGKGGSRRATLLLLLRKAFLSLLFVVTFMALLSAMGINIIPLIAGAGILGLAISFGAQSLIADIFAGIFFLIDDAFRVGDYVDCQGTKGTVEHISLRSLRLRHHRGMVHTLPFGKIGSVTNYTRDYIIMKLDIRVRYDTDVDKVRKIIKRIYQELQMDPDHGPKLIGKLKSQGVREMDDSAMIMRIKFTTKPGDQFELRKEVYRRIQEAFRENNIEFAHRNVTVYMPPDGQQDSSDPLLAAKQQGAAAGAALLQSDKDLHHRNGKTPDR